MELMQIGERLTCYVAKASLRNLILLFTGIVIRHTTSWRGQQHPAR